MNGCRIVPSRRFCRDLYRAQRMGCRMEALQEIIGALACGQALEEDCLDRSLGEDWEGYRECLVQPGCVLVYRRREGKLILYLLKLTKPLGGHNMFLLTEIKYRLLRARSRTALLLCIAAMLVGSMAFYLGNIQANRSALDDLARNLPVTARVVSLSGSKQTGLRIDTNHHDALAAAQVHDVLVSTTYSGARMEAVRNADPFLGGDTVIKGINNPRALLDVDPEAFVYGDGWDESLFQGSEPVCVASAGFMEAEGLKVGGEVAMPLYSILYGTMENGYYPVGEHTMKIVGTYQGSGMGDLYVPIQWLREITEAVPENFSYESMSAVLDDPMKLNDFKAALKDMGFMEAFEGVDDIFTGGAISVEDEIFIKTAGELRENLQVFNSFLLPFFAVIIGMITLVTFLILRGSRMEMAIASSLGRQKLLNAASHFFGALIAEGIGCVLAFPVMRMLIGIPLGASVSIVGMYLVCACVGTALALVALLRFDPLELLTKVD